MTDKFTITLEYDRDEILASARSFVTAAGTLQNAFNFFDMIYPAWDRDTRTLIMVELIFRDEDDAFYDLFTRKLVELNEKEGVTA